MERTAAILIERHGIHAFDFATHQAELLDVAGANTSVAHWRLIARAIEELLALALSGGTKH